MVDIKDDLDRIIDQVKKNQDNHVNLLDEGLRASLTSLDGFQDWIFDWMDEFGMKAERFNVEMEELKNQPAYRKTLEEDPSKLRTGSNVLGSYEGGGKNEGVLLYGHADKKPVTFEYAENHKKLEEKDGKLYGPGIADDVSGLTSMLSSIKVLDELNIKPAGDVMVASVLGKQMGVFGTYGLVTKFGPMDGAIYAHPEESGAGLSELKMCTSGLVEFHITVEGEPPKHSDPTQTIFANNAVNAIDKGSYVYTKLLEWAEEMDSKYFNKGLEELTGQSFVLCFSNVEAGDIDKVNKIPTECVLRGTICFPPEAELESVQAGFEKEFEKIINEDSWLNKDRARFQWGDMITDSAQADENSSFLNLAKDTLAELKGEEPEYYYGHAASDIRYPMLYWDAEAFGVGPTAGDIGKENEWVEKEEYLETIAAIACMLANTD